MRIQLSSPALWSYPHYPIPLITPPFSLQTRKLRDLTERLKITLAKIKKITQVEGRSKGSSAGVDSSGGGKGTGDAGGVGEDGGSGWRETGGRGLLDDMKGGINVNLKDVKVPEFDVRWHMLTPYPSSLVVLSHLLFVPIKYAKRMKGRERERKDARRLPTAYVPHGHCPCELFTNVRVRCAVRGAVLCQVMFSSRKTRAEIALFRHRNDLHNLFSFFNAEQCIAVTQLTPFLTSHESILPYPSPSA